MRQVIIRCVFFPFPRNMANKMPVYAANRVLLYTANQPPLKIPWMMPSTAICAG